MNESPTGLNSPKSRPVPQLFTVAIRPDEDVTGFLLRQSFLQPTRTTYTSLRGTKSDLRPAWVLPTGIAHIAASVGDTLPSSQEILLNHTRYPLFARFLPDEHASLLKQHHLGEGLSGMFARSGMGYGGLRGRMAVCPDCIRHDETVYGYAIWHRLMLMPGVFACHIHLRPLMTFCDTCESGHRRGKGNWRPQTTCLCGGSLKEVTPLKTKELTVSAGIAKLAYQVLNGNAPQELSAISIVEALRILFKGRQEEVDSTPHLSLEVAMLDIVGANLTSKLGFGCRTYKRFLGRCSSPIPNPIQSLAVIQTAFSDLEGFSQFLNSCRKGANTSTFKSDAKSSRRFRTQDSYIERHNLLPKQVRIALLAKHLRERRQLSLSMRPTKRITKTYLLSNFPGESAKTYVLQSEQILTLLNELVDTTASYRNRLIELLSNKVRKHCARNAYGDKSTYLHLSDAHFRKRISDATRWLQKNSK